MLRATAAAGGCWWLCFTRLHGLPERVQSAVGSTNEREPHVLAVRNLGSLGEASRRS